MIRRPLNNSYLLNAAVDAANVGNVVDATVAIALNVVAIVYVYADGSKIASSKFKKNA